MAGHLTAQESDPVPVTIPAQPAELPRWQLLDAENFPGEVWTHYSGLKDSPIGQTWSIQPSEAGSVLVCRGEPHGYLRTRREFRDFELGVEWRYPTDENGNSGILVYTQGDDKIWPRGIQVQLHKPKTGCIFGSSGARLSQPLETASAFSRGVNQWNELYLRSRKGRLSLRINGRHVGEAIVESPREGSIGLQSEGSEVHFRRFWIRELPEEEPLEANESPVTGENSSEVSRLRPYLRRRGVPLQRVVLSRERRASRQRIPEAIHVADRISVADDGCPPDAGCCLWCQWSLTEFEDSTADRRRLRRALRRGDRL